MEIQKYKDEFISLLRSTGRDGVEDVITGLEEMGFFTAPASANHHLNTEGGLLLHSLNTCKAALMVYEGMKALEPGLEKEVHKDSVILASLLHGQWEDCEGYKVSYKNFPMGHGEKSVILLLCNGLEMADDEMLAIRWHMGAWGINMNSFEDQRSYDTSRKLYPLVAIIQVADSLAASIMERSAEELDEI